MAQTSLHGTVSGLVQGVFFRAESQKKAQELCLNGWVRNLPDGRVEILFGGQEENVARMRAWLSRGPSRARVDSLALQETNVEPDPGFRIIG